MQSVFKPRRVEIESRVQAIAAALRYPLDITNAQRTMGPRPHDVAPPHGSEVFVSKLPREIFEDQLVPLFHRAGNIYKFRLMMSPSGISNRGTAYVTYENAECALKAIKLLNNKEVAPGMKIEVELSLDNRRIFVGGIPEEKNKDQVWQELTRVGMKGIVEVIMYRSYIDRNRNRGFVFVEFSTHEEASRVRLNFKEVFVFGNRVQIDWSSPLPSVDDTVMKRVKKLFLRNLNVLQEREEFEAIITGILGPNSAYILDKVYKYRDYAFIHFTSRRDAQRGLSLLRDYYKCTDVEVSWAKPSPPKKNNKYVATTSPLKINVNNDNNVNLTGRDLNGNTALDSNALAVSWPPLPNASTVSSKVCCKCLASMSAHQDASTDAVRRIFESLDI